MSESTIVLYSKASCVQCTATRRRLDSRGLGYVEVDVTEDGAALRYVREELGYSSAPVIMLSAHQHWSGFRPDLIDRLPPATGALPHVS